MGNKRASTSKPFKKDEVKDCFVVERVIKKKIFDGKVKDCNF